MILDINGAIISQASSILTVNNTGLLKFQAGGAVQKPGQIAFVGQGAAGTWVTLTNGAWQVVGCANVLKNIGGGYNGSLSRFTAPVTGSYLFLASTYLLRNGTNVGDYVHPVFFTNGGAVRNPNNGLSTVYRIKFYGDTIANYDHGQIAQIFQLQASDYVEHYMFSGSASGSVNQYYSPYARFSGILLG